MTEWVRLYEIYAEKLKRERMHAFWKKRFEPSMKKSTFDGLVYSYGLDAVRKILKGKN